MFDILFIIRFIDYKLKSKSKRGHGVHSPFVFSFIEKVMNDFSEFASQNDRNLSLWHLNLENNKDEIKISEIGAGSRKRTGGPVQVRSLVKKTGIRPKYGRLLAGMLKFYKPEKVIEFGTGLGVSTVYLADSLPKVEVHTVEGDMERLAFAENEFRKLGLKNIITYNENFEDFLANSSFKKGKYAIFIDGNHRQEPTTRYFNFFADICDEDSFIVIDDINWSAEMRAAWRTVKAHPSVSVSIDLFFIGIVFFKNGIPKQDYVLNF